MNLVMQACREMDVAPEAQALIPPEATPQAAVRALIDAGRHQAALQLLARVLPRRYAVAWLCQCARGIGLSADDMAGAALAERWVREPDEANRRAALDFAEAGDYATAGAWVAAAAGWAGGSLAPPGQPVVGPPPHLTACAAVAAINMMAAQDAVSFAARRAGLLAHALALLGDTGQAD
ncbi:DUF6931 family protein [Coralloluteibacterium thermophilus]|uniref:DUF6931 family protein n=1 Tax=Coralloluteibacterium thermophilum TaxID=2707049 RepID=A0ABV9NRU7_9GAMM